MGRTGFTSWISRSSSSGSSRTLPCSTSPTQYLDIVDELLFGKTKDGVTGCARKARALLLPSLLPVERTRTLPPKTKTIIVSFRPFFQNGQVIETFRGPGIYQPAVDLAIEKLRTGACYFTQSSVRACSSSSALKPPTRSVTQIHLFSEGAVCRSDTYKEDPQTGIAQLQRFKWGVCASSFLFITPQTTEPFPRREMISKVYIHTRRLQSPKQTRSMVNYCIVGPVGATGYSSSRAE